MKTSPKTTLITTRKATKSRVAQETREKQENWKEEKQQRIAELVKKLEQGVALIEDSEAFKNYLSTAARFHSYSPTNILLIMLQRPTATRVAGYKTWQTQFNRQVRKGEKGIQILAPRPFSRVTKDEVTGEEVTGEEVKEERAKTGLNFTTVAVFDVEQTEGEPLPDFNNRLLTGDDGTSLYQKLLEVARSEGIEVSQLDPNNFTGEDSQTSYNGYYYPATKFIYVKKLEPTQMAKTLAHELGHHFDEGLQTSNREERETVAEATAFIVGAQAGIDTSAYSFPYIALWASQTNGGQAIKKALERIQQAANRILSFMELAEEEEGEPAPASRRDQDPGLEDGVTEKG